MRSITCTNTRGTSVIFGEEAFSPFFLASVVGLYDTDNDVYITDNTMIDGGTYQGSRARVRNIIITVMDEVNHRYGMPQRDVLRELFLKGDRGTLVYTEDGESRKADYYVEYIHQVDPKMQVFYEISLFCDDPFFYALEEEETRLASWESDFEFIHEFIEEGEEFGHRSTVKIAELINKNAADNIGLTITITAIGNVTNPSVTRVESGQTITVGTNAKPMNMMAGDQIVITTGIGDKHVYLIRNDVKTEVNEYLTEDSEFIQLMRGENHFGYDAKTGEANMMLSIKYKLKYEGC